MNKPEGSVNVAEVSSLDSEEEKPSVQTFEKEKSSPNIEQSANETDQHRGHNPELRPLPNASASDQPASTSLTTVVEPTLRASNSEEIFPWPLPMRCAMMVKYEDRSVGPIGDPYRAMNGWTVQLRVDPGRHGRPTINLIFGFNNSKKDTRLSRNPVQRTDLFAIWRTGVFRENCPMIENLGFGVVDDPQSILHHLVWESGQQELPKVMTFKFDCNGLEMPGIEATAKKPWRGLHEDVQRCLDTFFCHGVPSGMILWFCVDSSPELAMNTWLPALQRAAGQS